MAIGGFVVPGPAPHRLAGHRGDTGVLDGCERWNGAEGQQGWTEVIGTIADAEDCWIPWCARQPEALRAGATEDLDDAERPRGERIRGVSSDQ